MAVKRVVLLALLALVASLALVACGDDDEPETTDTTPVETESVRAYFLRDGRVWPVRRDGGTGDGVRFALDALLEGPTQEEATQLEATTAIPEGTSLDDVSVAGGVATISLSGELSQEALAQVVYTATQFPEVESVDVEGQARTRADFEEHPPKGFRRLVPGGLVRLRHAYVIRCDEVVKDEQGRVVELRCTYDLDTKSGGEGKAAKVKGTIHWVSAAHALPAEVRLFGRLLRDDALPEAEEDVSVLATRLSPESRVVIAGAFRVSNAASSWAVRSADPAGPGSS